MPNLTPPAHRVLYEIYPSKAGVHEPAEALADCAVSLIVRLGRSIGRGSGGRRS